MKQQLLNWFSVLILLGATALGQNTFSSGSTGADGPFAPVQNIAVQVPPSGVYNYTTVTIASGVTVTYIRNANNTPVTILASGDVNIAGTISLDGQPGNAAGFAGRGGPGGFAGGPAGINNSAGSMGDGPGGGGGGFFFSTECGGGGGGGFETAGAAGNPGQNLVIFGGKSGPAYGSPSLLPLIGGSGGGGACGSPGGGGGGGGGAILIASSTSILFPGAPSSGIITAHGGDGVRAGNSTSGGGSGGAIRLAANTITGQAQLLVSGGGTPGSNLVSFPGGNGGSGFLRLEAFDLTSVVLSNSSAAVSGLPNSAIPTNVPSLQIASVGGVAAPANPAGSFQGAPDVVLPSSQANPVTVVINGANIPPGTSVTVTVTATSGTSTTASTTLSGTTASSSGNASIALGTGLSVIAATTVIDLTTTGDLKPMFINGEKVDKIEVAAGYGSGSETTYITHSGHRVHGLR
jgi:hypothetical protein